MRWFRWLFIAGAWAACGQVAASEPCGQLVSPLARLACYDRRPEEQPMLQSRSHGSCLKMSMASRCVGPLPGPPC